MESHITRFRDGVKPGFTRMTALSEDRDIGIALALLKLEAGQRQDRVTVDHQCAVMVLSGAGTVKVGLSEVEVSRRDVFDGLPHTFMLPRGTALEVQAGAPGLEVAMMSVPGAGRPEPLEVPPQAVRCEERGAGQLSGTFHRQVRTVVDGANGRGWGLVFGEVLNHAGRWSSYPPHHHPQPEIYYYRFDRPEGYGHAEVGERVFKVRSHDLTVMRAGEDHSQVSAPGYRMWYLWVIRNLKDQPYTSPEFTEEHRWLLDTK